MKYVSMRMMSFIISMGLYLSLGAVGADTDSVFFEGDFETAKVKAGEEGKLFFVDFYASWCTPCNWMDETVFKDTEVLGLLDSNYVSIKINIDDLDGYSIKEKYNIKFLPTMLIFNSEGQLIARIEETLSSRKFAQLLTFHNKTENKVRVTQTLNTSPSGRSNEVLSQNDRNEVLANVLKVNSESVHKYRVQIGVYTDYKNTQAIVQELKAYFTEDVIVENGRKNNIAVYRILIGSFEDKEKAVAYAAKLKNEHGIPGFVR